MKKLVLAPLTALALLSVAACSDTDNSTTQSTQSSPAQKTVTVAPDQQGTSTPSDDNASVRQTNDNAMTKSIETRPNVAESGKGGMAQNNPTGDSAMQNKATPAPQNPEK